MSLDTLLTVTRGAALGFALGLLTSLIANCRPEVALRRAMFASLIITLVTFIATQLNHRPIRDDESSGKPNETTR